MTKEEAKIIIGNIPINPENMDDCYTLSEYQEAKAMSIEALSVEPCEDCISREAALDAVCGGCPFLVEDDCGDSGDDKCSSREKVKALPSVAPARPKGYWIRTGDYFPGAYGNTEYVECSCCHEDSLEEGDYCPNCGAKMESEEL